VLPECDYRQWTLSVPYALRYRLMRDGRLFARVLTVFVRTVFAWQKRRARAAGLTRVHCGSVSLVQRYGSLVQVHPHTHTWIPDGVFVQGDGVALRFAPLCPPTDRDVAWLCACICQRVMRLCDRQEETFDDDDDAAMAHAQADAVTSPLSRPLWPDEAAQPAGQSTPLTTLHGGFSLHAGSRVGAKQRRTLERLLVTVYGESCVERLDLTGDVSPRPRPSGRAARGSATTVGEGPQKNRAFSGEGVWDRPPEGSRLLRYGSRPPLAQRRLSWLPSGKVRLELRKPTYCGQTHLDFEPLALLKRLLAILPPPRWHATRYHGIFSSHHKLRAKLQALVPRADTAPAKHPSADPSLIEPEPVPENRRATYAQLLSRVFPHDLGVCSRCGGKLRLIACIDDPKVVTQILVHLGLPTQPPCPAPARSPPQLDIWDLGCVDDVDDAHPPHTTYTN
jgi:hypothetical protein